VTEVRNLLMPYLVPDVFIAITAPAVKQNAVIMIISQNTLGLTSYFHLRASFFASFEGTEE
jgi:hypothetical protein